MSFLFYWCPPNERTFQTRQRVEKFVWTEQSLQTLNVQLHTYVKFRQTWKVARVRLRGFWRRLKGLASKKLTVQEIRGSLHPHPFFFFFLCCYFFCSVWVSEWGQNKTGWVKERADVYVSPSPNRTHDSSNPPGHKTFSLLRYSCWQEQEERDCVFVFLWVTLVFAGQWFSRHCWLNQRRLHCDLKYSSLVETAVMMVEVAGIQPLVCWLSEHKYTLNYMYIKSKP